MRKLSVLLINVIFSVVFVVLVYGLLGTVHAQEQKICTFIQGPSLKQGDTGPDVIAAQSILRSINFYSTAPSGVYDKTTARSVGTLQWAFGFPQTEIIDPATRNLFNNVCAGITPLPPFLSSLTPPVSQGVKPPDVVIMGVEDTDTSVELVSENALSTSVETNEDTQSQVVFDSLSEVENTPITIDDEGVTEPPVVDTTNSLPRDTASIIDSGPLTRELRLFSYNSEVFILENFLHDKKFLRLKPNKFFGFKTKRALKDFQTGVGVVPSGRLDVVTLNIINQNINL